MAVIYHFEVHTPYRLFFSDEVQAVTLTLVDGEIGIYAKRSPITAPVLTGILRIKDENGEWRSAFITSGILEVTERKTILIVEAAEWPEEIDKERAEAAGQQARENMEFAMLKFEINNAKEKLRRSEYRLKVAALAKQ